MPSLRGTWSRRPRAAVAAAAALALSASGLMLASGPATADDPAPEATSPLSLHLPPAIRTNNKYPRLGFLLRANGASFEVRAHRASYDDPITAEWLKPGGAVALPEGSVEWSGLKDFVRFTVTDPETGKTVRSWRESSCLNGSPSMRVRPDAEPTSPYPRDCPYNPYTLGSVQGIQKDWATTVNTWRNGLKLKPGRFTITATITPRFAKLFGISAEDRTDTADLFVKKIKDGEGGRRQMPGAGEAGEDGRHQMPGAGEDAEDAEKTPQPSAQEPSGRSGGDNDGPRPDLRPLPAFGITLNEQGTAMRFGANVWNAGDSPLVVDGFREDDEEHMDAYQYFFNPDGDQVGYEHVGELHYHHGNHNHWHFEDFAKYSLVDKDKEEIAVSAKQSFCLANTDAIDYTVPGAAWRPGNRNLATACGNAGSLSLREVLASGSGDTYYQFRTGQAFRLKGLPNGTYYIKIEANPDGRLFESDQDNNVSYRKVILKGTGKQRTVTVPQVGVIEEGDLLGER